MQKEFIIGILITIILLLVVIWAIFARKEKYGWRLQLEDDEKDED